MGGAKLNNLQGLKLQGLKLPQIFFDIFLVFFEGFGSVDLFVGRVKIIQSVGKEPLGLEATPIRDGLHTLKIINT